MSMIRSSSSFTVLVDALVKSGAYISIYCSINLHRNEDFVHFLIN